MIVGGMKTGSHVVLVTMGGLAQRENIPDSAVFSNWRIILVLLNQLTHFSFLAAGENESS